MHGNAQKGLSGPLFPQALKREEPYHAQQEEISQDVYLPIQCGADSYLLDVVFHPPYAYGNLLYHHLLQLFASYIAGIVSVAGIVFVGATPLGVGLIHLRGQSMLCGLVHALTHDLNKTPKLSI